MRLCVYAVGLMEKQHRKKTQCTRALARMHINTSCVPREQRNAAQHFVKLRTRSMR